MKFLGTQGAEHETRGSAFEAFEGTPLHFDFAQEDFQRVRELIHQLAGISLSPAKRDMVYSRLARRLRARGMQNFTEYLDYVVQGDAQEIEAFINALTTNMTSFFREPHHFKILAERLAEHRDSTLTIWTCASSTGEEPYSIAMTVLEALKSYRHQPRILATDIDTNVLATARRGVYPMDQLAKLPPEQLRRFFLRGEGKNEGHARVRDEVKQLLSFKRLNLLDESWPMRGRFDYIFCRNVMIYFDKQTQYALLKRLAGYLKPHGLLFVGHSESFHHASDLFEICGNTVYTLK
ncbi:chemotaxis protein methyltransferase [Geomonas silvestris]|uniref:protein-glutamate O-methyltransferase n=1 Tax=Geomonas silvestris TaxID=2740184 RepID=A0A6V8ML60_9BACT|nr:CheR family methyltransferase [Geomonas silvestris]GFO60664.1 chemotaxis protein methyltransferase [Geomonas silvestris]